MFYILLSLPFFLGCLIFMALTTAVGMMVYYATYRVIAGQTSQDVVTEIREANGNLIRVVG
ncbi:MAG: hypothetical protein ACYTHJ_05590 [Planctomycetota bacterium]|jgi:hypothetical protein